MTQVQIPMDKGLQKLHGTITNYKCTRTSANFVFTDTDKSVMGVIAIAASIAGLSAQAVSTAASANTEEEADYLEFDLDGKPVKGWVWRSPFKEDDDVEVVAEWQHDHFEAFAVARPRDRIVALYPHCSRGRLRHWVNAIKWWVKGVAIFLLIGAVFLGTVDLFYTGSWSKTFKILSSIMPVMTLGFYSFFLLMTISMAWKWMSFVRLAERVFRAFGWDRPSYIDLRKRSKETRTAADTKGYGIFFFRY
jgi:hypothetical protein